RQLGSHGARIAQDLALLIGYDFVDKSDINKVVRQYGLARFEVLCTTTSPRSGSCSTMTAPPPLR
ncbi:MAG TPA: hypothetical protein VGK53_12415, partial [Propionicimonas sp.]